MITRLLNIQTSATVSTKDNLLVGREYPDFHQIAEVGNSTKASSVFQQMKPELGFSKERGARLASPGRGVQDAGSPSLASCNTSASCKEKKEMH